MKKEKTSECAIGCAHFNKNIKFYRYRFLTFVFVGLILSFILFYYANAQYKSSINTIINTHQQFCENIQGRTNSLIENKDSIHIVINQELLAQIEANSNSIKSMMELQYNKLQSEYTALTLWASILMVIFLIFSIYSVFKIDEMQKQGRDTLNSLDDIKKDAKDISQTIETDSENKIKNIESKSQESITKITTETESKIKEFETKIDEERKKFQTLINDKTSELEKLIEKYQEELSKNAQSNKALMNSLIDAVREQNSSNK